MSKSLLGNCWPQLKRCLLLLLARSLASSKYCTNSTVHTGVVDVVGAGGGGGVVDDAAPTFCVDAMGDLAFVNARLDFAAIHPMAVCVLQ
jgi:hypothetical protein